MSDVIETDVLIIGAGIAGMSAAILLGEAGLKTMVIAKGQRQSDTNTQLAQGGIAALAEDEPSEVFVEDILRSGDYINYRPAVEMLVEESRLLVEKLLIEKAKVPFSLKEDGGFQLAREGAHSSRRILNVKDMTGRAIQQAMGAYICTLPSVQVLYQHTAIDLLTTPHHSQNPQRIYEEPRVIGAYVFDSQKNKVFRVFARKIILASGGLSSIFLHSTNPEFSVGNGIAMAHRAGARIANMEYIQFHPTALYHKEAGSFLISEAVRGEGARLMNRKGEYFMDRYSPLKDLAPRDIVSRAIYAEMIENGDDFVLLDLASFAKINVAERFPTIYEKCLSYGIDIAKRPIPVVPAAHYSCGGVLSDLNGLTSLKNLYAIGEVSNTGIHGANRLASVSLLECLVWGARSARHIIDNHSIIECDYLVAEVPPWMFPFPQDPIDPALIWQDRVTIKYIMWNYSGIIRTAKRLERARSDLEYLRHRIDRFYQKTELNNAIIDLRDSVMTALLVVNAALRNKVSRGAHFLREDEGEFILQPSR